MVMKNRQMIALLCAIGIGLVAATYANTGFAVFYSTPNDLPGLPHTETTLCMDQVTSEFRIDPNYNGFNYDVTPAITTETQTTVDIVHHSP
jgi:hypothetical protein